MSLTSQVLDILNSHQPDSAFLDIGMRIPSADVIANSTAHPDTPLYLIAQIKKGQTAVEVAPLFLRALADEMERLSKARSVGEQGGGQYKPQEDRGRGDGDGHGEGTVWSVQPTHLGHFPGIPTNITTDLGSPPPACGLVRPRGPATVPGMDAAGRPACTYRRIPYWKVKKMERP